MCKELNDPNIFLFLSAYGFSFFFFIFPLIKEFQSPITREAFPVSSRVYKHIGMHSHVLEVTSSDKQKKNVCSEGRGLSLCSYTCQTWFGMEPKELSVVLWLLLGK